MTNSRSRTSTSSWLAFVVAMFVAITVSSGAANAGGRKRVVVLDFDGPKGEKFHDDVVKLIKKSHTVIAVDKWNGAAEELDAAKVTEKNIKKIAKKLKVDGVVIGKIEKRRDEYIVQLKLRAGTSGEIVGNRIDTKADGPHLDGKAQRDVKDELIGAIDELEANHGGGDDDEGDAKPAKKDKHAKNDDAEDDADADAKPKKGGFGKKKLMDDEDADAKPAKKDKKDDKKAKKDGDDEDADAKPAKKDKKDDKKAKKDGDDEDADAKPAKKDKKDDKKAKKDDEDTAALSTKKDEKKDDEESPLPKSKKDKKSDEGDDEDGSSKKKKRVASKDDDDSSSTTASSDDGEKMTADEALSPANRAVDFVIGMSFTARRLSFNADADLADPPPSYKQSVPVAGGIMDVTVYPMAFSHKDKGIITGLGLEVMYDKVIKINSQKKYVDAMMNQQTADLATVEDRFSIGAVLRYPVNPTMVVGGKIQYSSQQFNLTQSLPNGAPTDVPNVHYSMVEPKGFLKYSLSPGIVINVDAGFMLVTSTGGIQLGGTAGYGPASVYGYELAAGLDYNLTKNIFVRAQVKFETIKLSFKGTDATALSNTRDTDTMQDVQGASDVYFGGMGTIGYAF